MVRYYDGYRDGPEYGDDHVMMRLQEELVPLLDEELFDPERPCPACRGRCYRGDEPCDVCYGEGCAPR